MHFRWKKHTTIHRISITEMCRAIESVILCNRCAHCPICFYFLTKNKTGKLNETRFQPSKLQAEPFRFFIQLKKKQLFVIQASIQNLMIIIKMLWLSVKFNVNDLTHFESSQILLFPLKMLLYIYNHDFLIASAFLYVC